jgi:lipoprotein-anchoring transpeptidase ErfK/SrfK
VSSSVRARTWLIAASVAIGCRREAPPGDALPTPAGGDPVARIEPARAVTDDAGASTSADDAASTEPATEPARLASRAQITWVYADARPGATKLGYLRAGAIVERDDKPTAEDGCKNGWYGIRSTDAAGRKAARGFVCVGDRATTDLDDPIVKAAVRRPDRASPLPYAYAIARGPHAPFYARIPTREESARLENDLDAHLARAPRAAAAALADAGPEFEASVLVGEERAPVLSPSPPDFLRDGRTVPNVSGLIKASKALWAGRPKPKEGFAIVASFLSGPGGTEPTGGPHDRRWDLTTEYLLLPHDRLRAVRPSAFRGIALGPRATVGDGESAPSLPIAFVRPRKRTAKAWLPSADQQAKSESLPPRTAIPLAAGSRRIDGAEWYATLDGAHVKAEDVIRLDPPKSWPAFANKGERWIDVSIAKQALVAYEGTTPVYATLVSTGRDGLGDPSASYATIRGVYRIHTKHVSITMDSTEVGEEFSLRDVPYVQYFETGYALHGAYWHDGFGEPRSHGCINLAAWDAQWLFEWTGPEVPVEWHAAMARPLSTGTPIWIHP